VTDKEIYKLHNDDPRFFYGYIVIIAAFLIVVVTFGAYSAFGVFFNSLVSDFGWKRAVTSGAFSLSQVIYGVLGIIMGGLNDRVGPRIVVTLCGLLVGLGYFLMSQVGSLWQLYLFFGVIVGIGMSGAWVPLLSSVARWFVRRRSLMTSIVVGGLGIGQLVGPLVVNQLISAYDWRISYAIMGGVCLLAIVLPAQFLRRDPARMGLLPYGDSEAKQRGTEYDSEAIPLSEAISTAQFWIFATMIFLNGFSAFAITVHIVPHATDLGISATTAASILSTIGALAIVGNYVLGGLTDRIGGRKVFIIGCFVMSASLFWLVFSTDVWMLYLFAVTLGFSLGMGVAESPMIAGLFGLGSHGLLLGMAHFAFTLGAATGPFVTGYIFDMTGSYQVAFLVCAAFGILALVLAVMIKPAIRAGSKV
jgi:MFS family permease